LGELGEGDGGGSGVVELGEVVPGLVVDAGAEESAGVEDDPDGLGALGLKLSGDEVSSAGGGGPADVAEVVSGAVFAETFKLSAEAALAHLAELEVYAAALGEEEFLVFGGAGFGVDADGLGEGRGGPANDETEGGAVAEVEGAGLDVSPLGWGEGSRDGGGKAGVDAELELGCGFLKLGWEIVGEGDVEDDGLGVSNGEFKLDGGPEGGGGEPGAGGGEGAGGGQAEAVEEGGGEYEGVPEEHSPGETGRVVGGDEPKKSEEEQN
jgi:hypothetical protein